MRPAGSPRRVFDCRAMNSNFWVAEDEDAYSSLAPFAWLCAFSALIRRVGIVVYNAASSGAMRFCLVVGLAASAWGARGLSQVRTCGSMCGARVAAVETAGDRPRGRCGRLRGHRRYVEVWVLSLVGVATAAARRNISPQGNGERRHSCGKLDAGSVNVFRSLRYQW